MDALVDDLANIFQKFKDQIDLSSASEEDFSMKKSISPKEIMLGDLLRKRNILTNSQIKNYVAHQMNKLLNSKLDLPEYCGDKMTKVSKFIRNHLTSIEKTVSSQFTNIPMKLQTQLMSYLGEYNNLCDDETFTAEILEMDTNKLLSIWKFIEFDQLIIDKTYTVELLIIKPIDDDYNYNNNPKKLKSYKYVMIIDDTDLRIQYRIINRKRNGYIVYVYRNDKPVSIGSYNKKFDKSGYHLLYNGPELKQILHYHTNLLHGNNYHVINHQISLVAPFVENKLHGLLQIIDSSRNIIYNEVFYDGSSLIIEPNLNPNAPVEQDD